MKPSPRLATLLLLALTLFTRAQTTATASATNPLLFADVPDPAILRVDNTYYMSSTTMHLSPGLPILKSPDLVNWSLVSYAYQTLGDNDALSLKNGKNAYGAGSWASSLRFHNGTFYVSTFSSTTGKTYIFSTTNIEKGPWTEHSFRPALHDHSLFFDDDGRVYMLHGAGDVHLTELNPDLSGIKPGGTNQIIIPNASLAAGPNVGLHAEGNQLRKMNGAYYHSMITWPKGGMRTQLIFRSDSLTGPYEGHIALQDQGIAQGGLIDTPAGDWYALLFQDHGAVGRTPCLVPVTWKDRWPVFGIDSKVPASLKLPASTLGLSGLIASDDFSRAPTDPDFPLAWQWNHYPDNRFWSLTQRPGFLRLTTARTDPDLLSARNSLTQRTVGPRCSATTTLDVSHLHDGDVAGLALLQKRFALLGVRMTGSTKFLVMIAVPKATPEDLATLPLTTDTLHLRLDCDFRNRADIATAFYSLDGSTWTPIGPPFHMTYTIPHFMGYRYALFTYATKSPGGYTDFDDFHITPQ